VADLTTVDQGTGIPDNASAETIFDGIANAVNPAIAHFHANVASAVVSGSPHTVPVSDSDKRVTYVTPSTISAYTVFQLPSTVRPGCRVYYQLTCTADGLLQFPSDTFVKVIGEARGGFVNKVLIEVVGLGTTSTTILVTIENLPQLTGSAQTLVFRQDASAADGSTGYLEDIDEFYSVNSTSGTPTSETKYSILDTIEDYRFTDGYLYFRAEWLQGGSVHARAEWRQASNPFAVRTYQVDGYHNYLLQPSVAGGGTAFGLGNMVFGGFHIDTGVAFTGGNCLINSVPSSGVSGFDIIALQGRAMIGVFKSGPVNFATFSGTPSPPPYTDPVAGTTYDPDGCIPGSTLSTNQVNLYALTPSDLTTGSF